MTMREYNDTMSDWRHQHHDHGRHAMPETAKSTTSDKNLAKSARKNVALDFDGVLHSYTSPFDIVPSDPPVLGAIDFLRALLDDERVGEVSIFSGRNQAPDGIRNMCTWLSKQGLSAEHIRRLSFPVSKPMPHVMLDDRAVRFTGVFPSVDELLAFVPWNRPGGELSSAQLVEWDKMSTEAIVASLKTVPTIMGPWLLQPLRRGENEGMTYARTEQGRASGSGLAVAYEVLAVDNRDPRWPDKPWLARLGWHDTTWHATLAEAQAAADERLKLVGCRLL